MKNHTVESIDQALASLETPRGARRVKESLRGLPGATVGDPPLEVEALVSALEELRRRSLL